MGNLILGPLLVDENELRAFYALVEREAGRRKQSWAVRELMRQAVKRGTLKDGGKP